MGSPEIPKTSSEEAELYQIMVRMAELKSAADEYQRLEGRRHELYEKGVRLPEDLSLPEGYEEPQPAWVVDRF